MKRVLVRLALLIGLGITVSVPAWGITASTSSSPELTTISNYRADFTVSATGTMTAVETLAVDFPLAVAKHGIFRFFDTWNAHDPHAQPWVPEDISVTEDGRPAAVELSWKQGHRIRVVRIGNADRYVTPGKHVYRITYRVDKVLEKGSAATSSQFYWNLVPGGWLQPIAQAQLTVHLPAAAQDVKCLIGKDSPCTGVTGAGTSLLTVHASSLPPNTSVTLKTSLDVPAAGPARLPWTSRWNGVFGTSVPVALVIAFLGLLIAAWSWLAARATREEQPGFPLHYEPPAGIGPAQAYYVLHEAPSPDSYVASLMYAADKGVVTLERGENSAWTVTSTGRSAEGLDPVSARAARLVSDGDSFTASAKDVKAGKLLKGEMESTNNVLTQWSLESNLLVKSGPKAMGCLMPLCFLLTAALAIWNPFHLSLIGLIPGLFVVFGIEVLAPGARTRRTPAGREVWSRVGGFERILATPSSEQRFDFASRKDLYVAYLPWAVAFGCADNWAKKYQTETGAEPPAPAYFLGYAAGTAGSVSSMADSFSSAVSASVSAYTATQTSSSSGGSSFSGGGGGGGGGGGSW